MNGSTRPPTKALTVGAALLVTATTVVSGAPASSAAAPTASSWAAEDRPAPCPEFGSRASAPAASRSLAHARRLAVPPLRVPGLGTVQRVPLLPEPGSSVRVVRPVHSGHLLPGSPPWFPAAAWSPAGLPWS